MVNVVLVMSLVFALVVAIFAVQNNTPVDISFLGWNYPDISLVLVILGSAVAGAVTVFLFSLVKQFKLKMDLRHVKSQNDKLTSQISALEAKIQTAEPAASPAKSASTADTASAATKSEPNAGAPGESAAQPCGDATEPPAK